MHFSFGTQHKWTWGKYKMNNYHKNLLVTLLQMDAVAYEGIHSRNKQNKEKSHFLIYSFSFRYHDHMGDREHQE